MFIFRYLPVIVWSISFLIHVLALDKCKPDDYNVHLICIIASIFGIVAGCYYAETTFDLLFPKKGRK